MSAVLRKKVGCNTCRYRLHCIASGTKCNKYASEEIRDWYNTLGPKRGQSFKVREAGTFPDGRFVVEIVAPQYNYPIHVAPPWGDKPKGYIWLIQ